MLSPRVLCYLCLVKNKSSSNHRGTVSMVGNVSWVANITCYWLLLPSVCELHNFGYTCQSLDLSLFIAMLGLK